MCVSHHCDYLLTMNTKNKKHLLDILYNNKSQMQATVNESSFTMSKTQSETIQTPLTRNKSKSQTINKDFLPPR